MSEIPCACGANKKRFKYDIGPYFVGDCCSSAGYDELGRKINAITSKEEVKSTDAKPIPVTGESAPSTFVTTIKATAAKLIPGRGTLRDMRKEQVAEIGKNLGLDFSPETTKDAMIAAIVAKKSQT